MDINIQALLKALEDETVRAKVREIVVEKNDCVEPPSEKEQVSRFDDSELECAKASLQKVESENEDLKQFMSLLCMEKEAKEKAGVRVGQLSEQNGDKDLLVVKLQADLKLLAETKNQLQNDVTELNQKLEYYRNNFRDDLQVLELYSRLSEQTLQSLSGIFKDTTVQGLISCGIQEKNISNLWDYAKSETVNGNNGDIANVISLFNLLFKRFTLAYPMFALQEVSSGDSFDTQCHIKHSSSHNTSGSITQIMLHGYVNTKTGKVIKPSVVKL